MLTGHYSQTFPETTPDGRGWGLPQLKIVYPDGSVSLIIPPTEPDDPGSWQWQLAPAEVRALDWSPRPQPADDVLRMHRDAALSRLSVWWAEQAAAGVLVGNHRIRSGTDDAVALSVALSRWNQESPFTAFDASGLLQTIPPQDVAEFAAGYESAYQQRQGQWATARAAIEAATTIEQLSALPGLETLS